MSDNGNSVNFPLGAYSPRQASVRTDNRAGQQLEGAGLRATRWAALLEQGRAALARLPSRPGYPPATTDDDDEILPENFRAWPPRFTECPTIADLPLPATPLFLSLNSSLRGY